MAVSFTTSNYRADFMVGSTGGAQQVETKSSGGSQFAEMLGSHGSGNPQDSEISQSSEASKSIGSVNSSETIKKGDTSTESFVKDKEVDVSEWEKFDDGIGISPIEKVEEVSLPESDMELARAIVRGEIDIKDVPAERITYALLKAIIMAKFEKKLEDDEKARDPKAKGNDQSNPSAEVDARLAILYKLIDAYVEAHNDDSSKGAEGLMSRIQELSEMMDEQEQGFDLTHMIAQIINNRAEAIKSEEGAETLEIDVASEKFINELKEAIGEENAKLLEQAIKDGEVEQIEKVLRESTDTAKEQPKLFDAKPVVNREVSEELEMLRSAKQNRAQKIEDEFAELVKSGEGETVKVAVEAQGADNNAKSETGSNSGKGSEQAVTAAETPVIFRADDGAEIEVQPSEVVSQAMKLVEQSIEDTAEQTEYSLTLNPGELGRITVRMIKAADGAVSVTIAAENAQTQRILETNSALMQNNLRSNGVQLESWQTVSESQQETLAQDYNGSSKNPYYRDDEQSDDEQPDESFADIIAAM